MKHNTLLILTFGYSDLRVFLSLISFFLCDSRKHQELAVHKKIWTIFKRSESKAEENEWASKCQTENLHACNVHLCNCVFDAISWQVWGSEATTRHIAKKMRLSHCNRTNKEYTDLVNQKPHSFAENVKHELHIWNETKCTEHIKVRKRQK